MAKRLNTYVHVTNPETGQTEVFGPDDTVPGWAEKAITAPGVWDDGTEAEEPVVPGPSQSEPFDPDSAEAVEKSGVAKSGKKGRAADTEGGGE